MLFDSKLKKKGPPPQSLSMHPPGFGDRGVVASVERLTHDKIKSLGLDNYTNQWECIGDNGTYLYDSHAGTVTKKEDPGIVMGTGRTLSTSTGRGILKETAEIRFEPGSIIWCDEAKSFDANNWGAVWNKGRLKNVPFPASLHKEVDTWLKGALDAS